MTGGGELEIVDRERVVKSTERKVRQKWCRNGAETEDGGAAMEVWRVVVHSPQSTVHGPRGAGEGTLVTEGDWQMLSEWQ
jgi:hypothetical protein